MLSSLSSHLIFGYELPELDGEMRGLLARYPIAGLFLFGEALGAREQVAELTAAARAAAGRPLLIAIDQEGGSLQAWGPPHRPALVGARELGRRVAAGLPLTAVVDHAHGLGTELREVGINLDFAPVVDVDSNPANPIIGDRSFSRSPEEAAKIGAAFIKGLQAAGVHACAKHFPGHGDTQLDSHLTLPTVDHDRARLERVELLPFQHAIQAGVTTIMTAHVLYPALDPDLSATLSDRIVNGVLRRELGFNGVVITDDLKMRGVRDTHDLVETSVLALRAGCDLLLSCTEHDRRQELIAGLDRELAGDASMREFLSSSHQRITALIDGIARDRA